MGKVESVTKRAKKKALVYEPEIVMVRALRRGWYGMRAIVEAKFRDELGRVRTKREIGRDSMIRNEGEVFEMDANDMRAWPLDPTPKDGYPKGEQPHGGEPEIIKVGDRQFELPSWVTIAEGEDETAAAGHTKEFGNRST